MTSTHARTSTLLLLASAMFWPAASVGQTLSHDSVRGAATRAVVAIQASQAQFVKKTACTSCHHQFQPAIAFAEARAHGIPVDEEVAALNAARSFDFTDIDAAVQFSGVVEPALQEGYRVIAAHASGVRPNLATALLARILMARQREAGDWSGLNQRPPSSSSDFAKTAMGLRAVQLHHHRADTGTAAASIARASRWLATHDAPDTEGRTYQLLGLHWGKGDSAVIRRVGQALAAAQRPDGGWGSIDGRASEAYSTGEALVALREAGVVITSDAVWRRGVAFLVRTQAPDGSWHVPSRLHDPARLSPPYFESGYPYGHDQFISVAGAAWAVMALADSLPLSTRETTDQAPAATTLSADAWVETVAFGSLDDLRAALDGGFDPNSKTTSGGTTPLMAAAGDVAKVRLLLDRGADLTRRAASGYSALMTAAQYGRNDAVLDLMLERGAVAAVAAEAVPGRQYALSLAVHAGNDAAVRKLHAAGEPVNEPFRLSKTNGPVLPMAMAVRNGDLAVVRALLDLGVPVEGAPRDPFSPLESAVHNDRLDLVRLFLERGADVNRIGRTGYTPLMFAASIDFGQTAMVDLLLSAGARLDLRNPAGKTALDLSLEYQHLSLAARLGQAVPASVATPKIRTVAASVTTPLADAWLGSWQVDLTQSSWSPGPPPQRGTFTAEALPDGSQKHVYDGVSADGGRNHSERVTRLDGIETPVAYTGAAHYSSRTDSYRRIDDRTFEVLVKDSGAIVARTVTVVAPNGTTLTQTRTGTAADGRPITNVIVHVRK